MTIPEQIQQQMIDGFICEDIKEVEYYCPEENITYIITKEEIK